MLRQFVICILVIFLSLITMGCNDDAVCPQSPFVLITSPTQGQTVFDIDTQTPGIQIEVRVQTNLTNGAEVGLMVTSTTGSTPYTETADANGVATFTNITVGEGEFTLDATAADSTCGNANTSITATAADTIACLPTLREGGVTTDFYGSVLVLNQSLDTNASQQDFQGNIDVATLAGYQVSIIVTDPATGTETTIAQGAADTTGTLSAAATLPQGIVSIRAECINSSGNIQLASTPLTFRVDTEAPSCQLTAPAASAVVLPTDDTDNDASNGTQFVFSGEVTGDDVEGEVPSFAFDSTVLDGSAIDSSGASSVTVTLSNDGSFQATFTAQDRAENTCSASNDFSYASQGCSITFVSPTTTVSSDANSNASDGVQVAVDLQVDSGLCDGETITLDCGLGESATTVPAGGATQIEVTVCDQAECDVSQTCTASVTSTQGFPTTQTATIDVDTAPPSVSLQFVNPATVCGATITEDVDVDGNASNGIQIDVRAISPLAASRTIEVTNSSGTTSTPTTQGGDATVTLEFGSNDVVAYALDALGNQGSSGSCSINLAEIIINFDAPISTGIVGQADGSISGSSLILDVCGTVSNSSATIQLTINGSATLPPIVTGNTWCANNVILTESPPVHTLVAVATAGSKMGQVMQQVTVDLSGPPAISNLTLSAKTRRSIQAEWTAPSDNGNAVDGYLIKYATTLLTDANFDSIGTSVTSPTPAAPGTTETLIIDGLKAGTLYYVGVVSIDVAGNRASVIASGPIMPDFDVTAEYVHPDALAINGGFGFATVGGLFNGDNFYDLAVAAPFENNGMGAVYVFFGSATGLSTSPDASLFGTTPSGQFGNSITAIEWSEVGRHDLVVSVPFAGDGTVFIFNGGSNFDSTADVEIGVDTGAGWYASSFLGWVVTAARFDGDSVDDLIISAPGGGSSNGGFVIVYGNSANFSGTPILLNETSATNMDGAIVDIVSDPDATTFDLFGIYMANIGPTRGAGDFDSIAVAYNDSNRVSLFRGQSAKPTTAGSHFRNFTIGTDVTVIDPSATTGTLFGWSLGSISDQNSDGNRDLVIGAYRNDSDTGRVVIVDGDTVGTGGVASIATSGVLLTDIFGGSYSIFGSSILNNRSGSDADFDGDGIDDLMITGLKNGTVSTLIWFGDTIPTGIINADSADHEVSATSGFTGAIPTNGGTPHTMTLIGDINGDGLSDICLAESTANGRNGAANILWDDGI